MSQERTQVQIQQRIRLMDDVFHNAIIALERLEAFILKSNSDNNQHDMTVTAVKTERDLHDDIKNPPTEQSMLAEVQLQCSALWFQTRTDDDERLEKSVKYFVEDLFSWYAGRTNMPFDEVEQFFIPLVGCLSRQLTSVTEIQEITKEYVTDKIKSINDLSEDEKEKAVQEGFLSWIQAQDIAVQRKEQFDLEEDVEIELTSHERGSLLDGYHRLFEAMTSLYPDDSVPQELLQKITNDYLPELLYETDTDETDTDETDTDK